MSVVFVEFSVCVFRLTWCYNIYIYIYITDNSPEFSPIMPDEIGEHLSRDQRPFLHPESLQILQIDSSMMVPCFFSSPHSFSGFRSGN